MTPQEAHEILGTKPEAPKAEGPKIDELTPEQVGKVRGNLFDLRPVYGLLDTHLGFWERALDQPLRWRQPRRIFVNSMSDLFHQAMPDEWIDRLTLLP